MCRHLFIIAGSFLCITLAASAQTLSPEAIVTARSLVATMKLGEQYKMLLPAILLRIKPVVTQERAELESDYDLIATKVGDLYTPYYNEMLEQAASVYAANFTVQLEGQRPAVRGSALRRHVDPRHSATRTGNGRSRAVVHYCRGA